MPVADRLGPASGHSVGEDCSKTPGNVNVFLASLVKASSYHKMVGDSFWETSKESVANLDYTIMNVL